jgi:hypothetical protein
MQEIIKTTWQKLQSHAKAKLILVMLVIALIGLPLVPQYGITVDEGTEVAMVRRNLEWIANKTPIPGDLKYFGTAFNVLSETVFQVKEFVVHGFSFKSLDYARQLDSEASRNKALKDRIEVKHYVTFIFSGITYLAVAGIVTIFCGAEYAWFGALSLAVMPIHWGHSFFNPKDTPFAAVFTLSSLMGAYLINYYFQSDQESKLGNNKATKYTILYGILLGLTSGVRIGAFLILFFFLSSYLLIWWEQGRKKQSLIKFLGLYALLGITWAIIHSICYPAFWGNPIAGFFETLDYLSSHRLQITVLFRGWDFPIQKIPRGYLLTWIFMAIPLIFHLGFVAGSTWMIVRYKRLSILQKACAIMVWWQVLFLPLFAVIRRSPVYDGMRHFLFITPGIVAIAAIAIIWLYQVLVTKRQKQFLVGLVVVAYAGIVVEMISLHPYQYVYINRTSGGIEATSNQFDLEVLSLSLREGMEWINQHGDTGSKVAISGLPNSARFYAAPGFEVVGYEENEGKLTKPFYYLSWFRWKTQYRLQECPIVHQVTRRNTALAIIRKCS